MNIWIISLFDPTLDDETRPMRFASLSSVAEEMDNKVTYFSNTFRHSTKTNRFEETSIKIKSNSYKIIYIKAPKYKKNISIKRFFSHYIYSINFMNFIKSQNEIPDVIISALPPLVLNYKLIRWVRQNNIKFVIDVIDPWPDVFYRFFPKYIRPIAKIFFWPYKLLLRSILNNVDAVVSISREYIEWARLNSKNEFKFHVSYPAIDFEKYYSYISSRNPNHFSSDRLRIVYAGNLGVSYDIPCILQAAKILDGLLPGKTEFYIAGLGFYLDLIKEYENKLTNLKYVGRLGFDDLMKLYSNCHLGLSQYTIGATQTITYKLFDYLGSGLPILNSLKSEMWDMIDNNKLGLNNKPGNVNELVENIIFFMDKKNLVFYSDNALKFCEEFGNSKKVYRKYVDFLRNLYCNSFKSV